MCPSLQLFNQNNADPQLNLLLIVLKLVNIEKHLVLQLHMFLETYYFKGIVLNAENGY